MNHELLYQIVPFIGNNTNINDEFIAILDLSIEMNKELSEISNKYNINYTNPVIQIWTGGYVNTYETNDIDSVSWNRIWTDDEIDYKYGCYLSNLNIHILIQVLQVHIYVKQ